MRTRKKKNSHVDGVDRDAGVVEVPVSEPENQPPKAGRMMKIRKRTLK
jgi:hypothetical protein